MARKPKSFSKSYSVPAFPDTFTISFSRYELELLSESLLLCSSHYKRIYERDKLLFDSCDISQCFINYKMLQSFIITSNSCDSIRGRISDMLLSDEKVHTL